MGGRYCAINSPRGSRWGQKSRDRGPSGELIVQYWPPMSFCLHPTPYLGNHLYFQAWQFLKTAKEYIILGDRQRPLNWTCCYCYPITFTCDVIMVPVITRAPNITNVSCWKIAPKPLVYINQRILLNGYLYLVKQFKIESSDIFKFWNISKISMLILSIGTSLFEVLPLWTASPIS